MAASDITGQLARYMVEARGRSLSPDVAREARHRILDLCCRFLLALGADLVRAIHARWPLA